MGCEAGNSALVSLLVKVEGVEVNCPDERGWTGAHHASYRGHTECLTILEQLESVDWRRRNSDGLSPLHYLISRTESGADNNTEPSKTEQFDQETEVPQNNVEKVTENVDLGWDHNQRQNITERCK